MDVTPQRTAVFQRPSCTCLVLLTVAMLAFEGDLLFGLLRPLSPFNAARCTVQVYLYPNNKDAADKRFSVVLQAQNALPCCDFPRLQRVTGPYTQRYTADLELPAAGALAQRLLACVAFIMASAVLAGLVSALAASTGCAVFR